MPSSSDILSSAPATDQSVGFFNDIFGTGWQSILEGTTPTGGASGVLFTAFSAFNAVILACVCVMMFYIVSSGIVGTAHEGEALGKRYSTLWTPLRSALAISFLMPLPWAKLSLLQALALKFVFLSIGGADYLANQVVAYMVQQGGAVSVQAAPTPLAQGLASEMLLNEVFQEYYLARDVQSYGSGTTDTSSTGGLTNVSAQADTSATGIVNSVGTPSYTPDKVYSFIFTPPASGLTYYAMAPFMGRITTACHGVSDSVCSAENDLGLQLSRDLRPIAKAITSQWSGGANTPMDATQITAYNQAISNYARASQANATSALQSAGTNSKLTELTQQIQNNGWVWLGVYYMKIAHINEIAQSVYQTKVAISNSVNTTLMVGWGSKEITSTLLRYSSFVEGVEAGRQQQISSATAVSDSAGLGSLIYSAFSDGLMSSIPGTSDTAMTGAATVLARVIGTGDPIANLQVLGHQLINAGTTMVLMSFAKSNKETSGGMSAADAATKIAGGPSPAIAKGVAEKLLTTAASLLLPVGGALVMAGIMLAYYLPMMPFILWTSAVVGWLVLNMELMVATSIWAATHAVPEGEGMAGQHGRQGYLMFFGILIRPALHVIGYFMAVVVVNVIGHFVGTAYLDFTTSSGNGDLPMGPGAQLIAWMATIFVGTGLLIVSSSKAFTLITWLPDNVLKWAGGNSPSLGEHNDEGRVSSVFGGMISKGSNTARGVGAAISGAAKAAQDPAKGAAAGGAGAGSTDNHSQGDKKDKAQK